MLFKDMNPSPHGGSQHGNQHGNQHAGNHGSSPPGASVPPANTLPVPPPTDIVPPVQVVGIRFEDLHLIEPLVRAVHAEGYTTPTPIQVQAIPHALEGRDVLG